MRALAFFAAALLAQPAFAQVLYPPATPVDTSSFATKTEVLAAQTTATNAATAASTAQSAIPQPATTVGNGEQVGGAVGTSTAYKRADWIPPRISRTGSCVLSASGVCTASWTTAFAAGATPVMLGDPVAQNTAGSFPITCNITAAPTTASVPIKCWLGQSSVISVLGASVLSWNTTSLSGVTVTVGAIPASQ